MRQVLLSTIDNPINPFEDYLAWYQYDSMSGNNCCGLVERFFEPSDAFTDEENEKLYEEAIDDIIKNDLLHIYKKVVNE